MQDDDDADDDDDDDADDDDDDDDDDDECHNIFQYTQQKELDEVIMCIVYGCFLWRSWLVHLS